jgi:hypothetical protein
VSKVAHRSVFRDLQRGIGFGRSDFTQEFRHRRHCIRCSLVSRREEGKIGERQMIVPLSRAE